ncbi:hypothetical protein QF000_002033 [Paraburkholderia atlantica]|uniref:hypothetical protein n=1 Tax=Paraburkholderia atlantica TaxID=2654982 RepID=UPI00128DA2F6|nr:hypothetical protein [Paraburkholderia atlantica]MBB5414854.1 hypothetical protein [Paraburkholderia atlantica]MPW05086.1 hypothetical protein [Paraburkholderia atlantica]NUY29355.1 hypothetical protein [Paraburkholderia atlantica]
MNSSSRAPLDVATEAASTLSEYLELSLDKGQSLIFVLSQGENSEVYLGDPGEPDADWTSCAAIPNTIVHALLETTRSGFNQLVIEGQAYRFARTFAQVAGHGAVVFTPA